MEFIAQWSSTVSAIMSDNRFAWAAAVIAGSLVCSVVVRAFAVPAFAVNFW